MLFFQKPRAASRSIHSAISIRILQVGAAVLLIYLAVGMRLSSDNQDNTPLAEAVERNDIQAATALLQGGADPNRLFVFDNKTARSAFWENATARYKWLESFSAPQGYSQRESLVWLSAEKDQPEMARLLLRHGANPNLAGNDADTALWCAAGDANAAFVTLLLSSGANVNQPGKDSQTALAHTIGSAELFNLEEESRSRNGQTRHDSYSGSGRRYLETTRLLIAAGANVNAPMRWGRNETPLHYARREGFFDIVTCLTKAGAK